MSEVTMIDMSAIIAMESIRSNLSANNVGLVINNLQSRMVLKLRRAGIRTKPGKISFSRTITEALDKAKKMF
jgi:SulP family sulfate permease